MSLDKVFKKNWLAYQENNPLFIALNSIKNFLIREMIKLIRVKKLLSYDCLEIAIILVILFGDGQSAILTVEQGQSLQNSIDSSLTGDTILVKGGIYIENIVINKTIILKGIESDRLNPTIISFNKLPAVAIASDSVSIEGFNIIGNAPYQEYSSGIYVISNNNSINNNHFIKNYYGISLMNSSNNLIVNNSISFNSYGIKVENSSCNRIFYNKIQSNIQRGIEIFTSNNNIISCNVIRNNMIGITLTDSNYHMPNAFPQVSKTKNNLIINNEISDSLFGIYVLHCSDNSLSRNIIFNSSEEDCFDSGNNLWDDGYIGNYYGSNQISNETNSTLHSYHKIPGGNSLDRCPASSPENLTLCNSLDLFSGTYREIFNKQNSNITSTEISTEIKGHTILAYSTILFIAVFAIAMIRIDLISEIIAILHSRIRKEKEFDKNQNYSKQHYAGKKENEIDVDYEVIEDEDR